MAAIEFFNQGISSFKLSKPRRTAQWVRDVIIREKKQLTHLNFIFCSDEYLRSINQQYLNHKTLTDIITFDSSEEAGFIEGDVFISVERVRENSREFETDFENEIHRVLIHGVLHLIGYSDKSPRQRSLMRKKEDAYLSLQETK